MLGGERRAAQRYSGLCCMHGRRQTCCFTITVGSLGKRVISFLLLSILSLQPSAFRFWI